MLNQQEQGSTLKAVGEKRDITKIGEQQLSWPTQPKLQGNEEKPCSSKRKNTVQPWTIRAVERAPKLNAGGMQAFQTKAEGIHHQQFYGLRNVTELQN